MSVKQEISVAPMIDYTNRHFRYFFRGISRHATLFTEMITTQALIQGDTARQLAFHAIESPLICQLGGSRPKDLAQCARIVEQYGYSGVNLNVGCPSDRVQAGAFGACLMKEASLVADCFAAMQQAVAIPVSIKCRTGVDNFDSYAFFADFVDTIQARGCRLFYVHARKAWLKGLSPKQNRTIPALQYDYVLRLKNDFPDLSVIINGQVPLYDTSGDIDLLNGKMIGRAAYNDPYHMIAVDSQFYGDEQTPLSRHQVFMRYFDYVVPLVAQGTSISLLIKPLLGLMHGIPGGKQLRQMMSAPGRNLSIETLAQVGLQLADTEIV